MARRALTVLTLIIVVATAAGGAYYLTHGPARPEERVLHIALVSGGNSSATDEEKLQKAGVELVRTLARMTGYDKVQIHTMGEEQALEALRSGSVQLLLRVAWPEEDTNTTPTLVLWDCREALIIPRVAGQPQTVLAKSVLRVGVPSGLPVAEYPNPAGIGAMAFENYTSLGEAVDALVSGRLDGLVAELTVAEALAEKYNLTVVQVSGAGVQLRLLAGKGNEDLLRGFQDALHRLLLSSRWVEPPVICPQTLG